MTRNLFAISFLSIAFAGVVCAQSTASSGGTSAHFTHLQLKRMVAEAHTPEQYKALASYYSARRDDYLQQAAEAKKDWELKSKGVTGRIGKYPRPMDSARSFYEYNMSKASEAGALEAKYSQMAAPGTPALVN